MFSFAIIGNRLHPQFQTISVCRGHRPRADCNSLSCFVRWQMTAHGIAKPVLLILGARGFLGRFAAAAAESSFRVIRADRDISDPATDIRIDITDPASVSAGFLSVMPSAVLLLAAISDIDRCERDPAVAQRVNLEGAVHVANACATHGARLLFTSTGAVFDGTQPEYREADPPTPLSVYGCTKADAEAAICSALPAGIVVRVSLVLGRSGQAGTNSLVDGLIRRWQAQDVVSASTTEARNPIDAPTLAAWFVELLQNRDASGIFHAGSTGMMTRLEIAQALAQGLGFPESLVRAETTPPPGRAPRGARQFLIPERIAQFCRTPAPTCDEVLKRSLNEPAQGNPRA